MAEVYGYFNGLEYDEKFPMMRVASLIPTGVYNDSLHVSAGTGLTVYVAAGKAWVNGYFYFDPDAKQITIDIADADNTRKDIIVLRLDTVNRLMEIAYKKGNPSVYPTPPTLQRNNDLYELQLAEILVPAGSASISAATITDTRSDSGLCGITAGFQGLDVAGLTAQAQAKFDTWFANLQNQLDSNQAGNLQNQIDEKQPQTAARSAMVKADAVGKLIAAAEDTDYFAPHSTTVAIGSGWGSTLYLSRIGKIVVCVWVSTSNPYIDTVWTTMPATIPAGYRPVTNFEQLRPLYDRTGDFMFGSDGSIKVYSKTAGTIPFFTPGAFCWVTA